jgi:hypothetical protein
MMAIATAIAAKAATTTTIDYPALKPDSRQARIIEQNLGDEPMRETDLVRVKTPLGGATKWTVEVNGNQETCDEIVGLFVGEAKRGVLWPDPNPTEQRPVIITNDLLVGYRVSDSLGTVDPKALEKYRIGDRRYDWAALSASPEFGYGAGGGQKRVKESRILAILREGDVWPMLVTIGPGSLAAWMPFRKRLPCFHYEAVLGLKLEKAKGSAGQPYSMIVPRLVGEVSEEQGEIARRLYTEPLKAMFSAIPAGAGVSVIEHDGE